MSEKCPFFQEVPSDSGIESPIRIKRNSAVIDHLKAPNQLLVFDGDRPFETIQIKGACIGKNPLDYARIYLVTNGCAERFCKTLNYQDCPRFEK